MSTMSMGYEFWGTFLNEMSLIKWKINGNNHGNSTREIFEELDSMFPDNTEFEFVKHIANHNQKSHLYDHSYGHSGRDCWTDDKQAHFVDWGSMEGYITSEDKYPANIFHLVKMCDCILYNCYYIPHYVRTPDQKEPYSDRVIFEFGEFPMSETEHDVMELFGKLVYKIKGIALDHATTYAQEPWSDSINDPIFDNYPHVHNFVGAMVMAKNLAKKPDDDFPGEWIFRDMKEYVKKYLQDKEISLSYFEAYLRLNGFDFKFE